MLKIKLRLTLPFQCVAGRKIASSQTVSVHPYMQSDNTGIQRRHCTEHLRPEDSEWCHRQVWAEALLSRPQRKRRNITTVCGCSARLCSLRCREMFVFGWRTAETASLFGSSSFHLIKEPSTQCRNPITWHVCVVIISIFCGSMCPNISSFTQTMLLHYILNGTWNK